MRDRERTTTAGSHGRVIDGLVVAGVDGTKCGWIAVVLRDGRFTTTQLLKPVGTDSGEHYDASIAAIDVPVGFGDAHLRFALDFAA